MSFKGKSSSDDKRTQWWTSIIKEKLDALRWVMLHSGLNVAGLQNDDGFTGIQLAAMSDKPKSLLVILDILRQKRELAEAIDVPTDEKGMTPLMIASQKGYLKCVDHLLYYGASLKLKSPAGLTARDYAKPHPAVVEFIDEELGVGPSAAAGAGGADEVDADGLTSTQRSKLKKKQKREGEAKGVLAAVAAAASAAEGEEEGEDAPADAEGAAAAASGGSGISCTTTAAAPAAAPAAAAAASAHPFGLAPLPRSAPAAVWPEVKAALADKRRELAINHVPALAAAAAAGAGAATESAAGDSSDAGAWSAASSSSGSGAAAPASAAAAAAALLPEGTAVDPALWHCALVNRLELRVPDLTALPDAVGHLCALQTLILKGNGLEALPEALAALVDLRFLDVSRNALVALPAAVGRLPKLEVLDLSANRLASLTPLAPCTSLVSLLADGNAIADLPLAFAGLTRLETLSLSHNALTELPDEVGLLGNLSALNVSSNALTELPAGLAELKEKKIKDLRLLPNPFADKKMLKIINSDRPEKLVSLLWKFLADSKGSSGAKGKGKRR